MNEAIQLCMMAAAAVSAAQLAWTFAPEEHAAVLLRSYFLDRTEVVYRTWFAPVGPRLT
jgi:hypothetical protein